jgi:hypothetical protein
LDNYIVNPNGCWSHKTILVPRNDGYMNVVINKENIALHRLSYSLLVGDISNELMVLHKCNNQECFNPEHLYLGDYRDNTLDTVKAGNHHNAVKTHCIHGHEFTSVNIYYDKSGSRHCKTCALARYQSVYI